MEFSLYTKEHLEQGLEWISGKTKISVKHNHNFIDVTLYPNYPNKDDHINLFLKIGWDKHITVTDLIGNGYNSRYQGQGYGSLIFNVGIQAIYCFFKETDSEFDPTQIKITGSVSDSGDPPEEPAKTECFQRRNKFWRSRGFTLKDPTKPQTSMQARLSELIMTKDGITNNGAPKYIKLDDFWLKDKAPALLKSDIDALMKVGLDLDSLSSIPTPEKIDEKWQNAIRWSRFISKPLLVIAILSVSYFSFTYLPIWDALSYSVTGLFVSYIGCYFLQGWLYTKLPIYRSYKQLQSLRGDKIRAIRNTIEKIEDSHNGLIWRIHEGLVKLNKSYDQTKFEKLAEHSKNQYFFYLQDKYEQYVHFIEHSKLLLTSSDACINNM